MNKELLADFLAKVTEQAKEDYLKITRDWPKMVDEEAEEERFDAFLSGYFHGIAACTDEKGHVQIHIRY